MGWKSSAPVSAPVATPPKKPKGKKPSDGSPEVDVKGWSGIGLGGSTATMGGTITGGNSGDILYIFPAEVLSQSSAFTWDDTTHSLKIGDGSTAGGAIHIGDGATTQDALVLDGAAGRVSVGDGATVRGSILVGDGTATPNAVVINGTTQSINIGSDPATSAIVISAAGRGLITVTGPGSAGFGPGGNHIPGIVVQETNGSGLGFCAMNAYSANGGGAGISCTDGNGNIGISLASDTSGNIFGMFDGSGSGNLSVQINGFTGEGDFGNAVDKAGSIHIGDGATTQDAFLLNGSTQDFLMRIGSSGFIEMSPDPGPEIMISDTNGNPSIQLTGDSGGTPKAQVYLGNTSGSASKLVFYDGAGIAIDVESGSGGSISLADGAIFLNGNNGSVTGVFFAQTSGVTWTTGSGSPEGAVTAPVGSLYTNTAGSTNTTLYVKTSGTGNTGWTAK